MSIATDSIFCDSCDFRAGTAVSWGRFIYRLQGGEEVSLNRTLGWCYSCASIEPIEVLSDKDKLEAGAHRLTTELDSFGKVTFFERIRGGLRKREDAIKRLTERLSEENKRLRFLAQRKSPPKCLACGSEEVEEMPHANPEEGGEPINLHFIHPHCGGTLWIEKTGIRYMFRFTPKYYDSNGLRLPEGDDV